VNYSRSKTDTIISTFSATCKSDDLVPYDAPRILYEDLTPPSNTGNNGNNGTPNNETNNKSNNENNNRTKTDHFEIIPRVPNTVSLTVSADIQHNGLSMSAIQNAPGIISVVFPNRTRAEANILWSGFFWPDRNDRTSAQYTLRGAITDPLSNTQLGYVLLVMRKRSDGKGGYIVEASNIKISSNAINVLRNQGTQYPGDYWSSLPSCGTAGPFLPSGLNILQQLSNGTGATVLQNGQ